MNLHEYQAKMILNLYGIITPQGILANTPKEALEAAISMKANNGKSTFAVKAQVHAGGRGKGGGVKIAKTLEEVDTYAKQLIGMRLVTPQTSSNGKLVRKVLIQEDVYSSGKKFTQEYYISILLNKKTNRNMFVYSSRGGLDIEQLAIEHPEKIFYEDIDPTVGLLPFQSRKIAFNLGISSGEAYKNMLTFLSNFYEAYISSDAILLEINPLVKTSEDQMMAVDAKMIIDNDSIYRHSDIAAMRDLDEEEKAEIEAESYGLKYVKLEGDIGCMVNGAGLAMATVDMIKYAGGKPANFLDIGGSANSHAVEKAIRIILKDQNVKSIMINIFGGIVRCDRIANGLIDAFKIIGNITVPIVVRLKGTKSEEAKQILSQSGLNIHLASDLREAADLAINYSKQSASILN